MKLAALLALGLTGLTVTTLPRPPFPGPVTAAPDAKRLVVVSSRKVSPSVGGRLPGECNLSLFSNTPGSVRGLPFQRSTCFEGMGFAYYGRDGASLRILIGGFGSGPGLRYTLDFQRYVWPPRIKRGEREFVYEQLVWAREASGVLYVSNGHLTYAKSSYGQNAYVTAIDPGTGRRLWRSKALVSNAQTFAVTPRYLVTGYGFTAEEDWLYLLDRRTGRVVERLALPSAPEKITRSGKNFVVRTYDHVLTVRVRES